MGVPLSEMMRYTLRQLFVSYDSFLLDRWDQTTTLHTALDNIFQLVSVLGSKKKPKLRDFSKLHPYRESVRQITPQNVELLQALV